MIESEFTNEAVSPDDLKRAMSHPATEEVVKKHVAKGNVKLVHKDSLEPMFEKQMSEIGQKGAAVADGPAELDETLVDDPEDAKLVANQEAEKEIAHTVNELVRTNSLTKGRHSKKGSVELGQIEEEF